MKKCILFAMLLMASQGLLAQSYFVRLETLEARLYLGYKNLVYIPILHPGDSVNTYVFHAVATGADIDYDESGRMEILPYQKNGHVDVYTEVNQKVYYVGKFQFEGVQPPPLSDATFVEVMGITKDNPQTKLKKKKKYKVPAQMSKLPSWVDHGAFPIYQLRAKENVIKVAILLRGEKTYTQQQGKVEVTSTDATIKKVSDKIFHITPLPGKKKCRFTFSLDGKIISEESLLVME